MSKSQAIEDYAKAIYAIAAERALPERIGQDHDRRAGAGLIFLRGLGPA